MYRTYSVYSLIFRLFLMVCISMTMLIAPACRAGQASVAVIYPEGRGPYNSMLLQVLEGINEQAGAAVAVYPLGQGYDRAGLLKRLNDNNADVVIVLGRRGVEAVQTLGLKKPIVVGAAPLMPEFMAAYGAPVSTIRLTPDIGLLFAKLREVVPASNRIIVITSASKESWLLRTAYEAARKNNFELTVHEASDIQMAAGLYRRAMGSAREGGADVVWLPPDDESIDIRGILPEILQEAWIHKIPVFCSNPAHVKRGALFALYPDNPKMGRRLAILAMNMAKNGSTMILPAQDVLTAVNMRTAEHLGLGQVAK